MKIVVMVAALIFSAPAYASGFLVDMSEDEINSAAGVLTVNDLAIGEAGLGYVQFCINDDQLFIPAATRLIDSRSEYGTNFRIRKEPGGSVRLDIFFGEKAKEKNVTKVIADQLASASNSILCKAHQLADGKLIPVANINGLNSAKQALGLD